MKFVVDYSPDELPEISEPESCLERQKPQCALTYFTPPLLRHVLFSCLPLNLFHLIWFARSPFPRA